MIRWGLRFLGMALVGVVILVSGWAKFGPCNANAAGLVGLAFFPAGTAAGLILLISAGVRDVWREHQNRPLPTK